MADDITLTVRVRDMTRGEFNQIRQRMRGMGGDIRRISREADGATQSSDRFANSLTGLQRNLSQFQRTGRAARHEMDFMRRSMGLLGRDLRSAAADGELTEDQFRDLRRELERTRLDFDHLDNQLRRQDAMAQRRARSAAERQREAERLRREAMRAAERQQREEQRRLRDAQRAAERQQREEQRRARERARMLTAAAVQRARDEQRVQRDADRARMAALVRRRRQEEADRRRYAQDHAAAIREEAARNRRAEADRVRAARAAAQAQQRSVGRLAGMGGGDRDLAVRFRAMGEGDLRRMSRGFDDLQRTVAGVSGSTARARRNVGALSGDLRTMAQALRGAQDAGSLSRREFSALSNGLRMTVRDARMLRDSGDMTRSAFRDMRREVAGLRAQLRLLGSEGSRLHRLDDRMVLLQRRMRDVRSGAGRVRRSVSRLGEGGVVGLRGLVRGLDMASSAFGRFRQFVSNSSRGMKMFLLVLGLIGPLAAPLGALLTTVLGGAFIALGAFALRSEKNVRSAFDSMKSTIGSTVREAAQPLQGPLILAMQQVASVASTLEPMLNGAFAATAPLVTDFTGALTGLLSSALPGFLMSLQSMGPVMEGFRTAMEDVGSGLGEMFAAMTADGGAEGLRRTWELIGSELDDLLVDIGEFISAMSQSAAATTILTGMFEALSAILVIIEGAFAAVDAVLGPLIDLMHDLGLNLGLLGLLAKLFESLGVNSGTASTGIADLEKNFSVAGKSSEMLRKQLMAVDREIANIEKTEKALKKAGLSSRGDGTDPTADLQRQRRSLLDAIAAAESDAAAETSEHAAAVARLTEQLKTLNNEMLGKLDARAAMESSIDDAIAKAEKFTGTVQIQNGVFDLTHEKSLEVYQALARVAKETANAATQAEQAKAPLDEINAIWARGREQLMALAPQYGISTAEMAAFIDTVLQTPESVQTKLEVDKKQADAAVAETKKKLRDVDGTKAEADATVAHFRAMERLSQVESALSALNGKTATTYVNTFYTETHRTFRQGERDFTNRDALGGRVRGYASGDQVQFAPEGLISGPGGGTTDSIMAMFASGATGRISNTEFVVNANSTRKYLPLLHAINKDKLPRFAKGGAVRREARQAISPIKAATSGTTEKNLLRLMSQIIKGSIKMASALKSVTSALDKAKTKLSSLRTEASSLSSGVKSRTMTDVTAGVDPGKAVTTRAIMGRMTVGRDKATAFASALKKLKARGLSSGLLRQIAEAGVEGGGLETAGALLRASGSEIKSLNSLHSQMSSAAGSAGKTTADAVYGKQIKIQEKLVKSLDELAKELKKATAKSKKKKATGGIIGAATGGLRGGLVEVGEQGPELVRLPFGSSVYSNADSRRIAGGRGGSSGQPTVIQVFIGEKKVDEVVLDSNRRTVRTRGGNVQAIFSQR